MMAKLIALFVVVPLVETALLIEVGSRIGPLTTILIILITGITGGWLAKREGFAVLQQLSHDVRQGIPPASRLTEGVLILVGGVLLVTPGVLTDITGLSLVFPITRRFLAPRVLKWISGHIKFDTFEVGTPPSPPENGTPQDTTPKFDHPVR